MILKTGPYATKDVKSHLFRPDCIWSAPIGDFLSEFFLALDDPRARTVPDEQHVSESPRTHVICACSRDAADRLSSSEFSQNGKRADPTLPRRRRPPEPRLFKLRSQFGAVRRCFVRFRSIDNSPMARRPPTSPPLFPL
jgi:hypothetical protein